MAKKNNIIEGCKILQQEAINLIQEKEALEKITLQQELKKEQNSCSLLYDQISKYCMTFSTKILQKMNYSIHLENRKKDKSLKTLEEVYQELLKTDQKLYQAIIMIYYADGFEQLKEEKEEIETNNLENMMNQCKEKTYLLIKKMEA